MASRSIGGCYKPAGSIVMVSKHARQGSRSYVRPGWHLIAAFTLTVASFVASTGVALYRSRGIEAAVDTISTNALPSIQHLAAARTQLRQMELALDRAIRPQAPKESVQRELANLRQSRETFDATWQLYAKLPVFAGETELRRQTELTLREMEDSIDRAIERIEDGDSEAASVEVVATTEPLLDRVDALMVEDIDLNTNHSADLTERIGDVRVRARRIQAVLTGLSAALTVVVAAMMVRMLDRFTTLMEARVSEMEHFAGRVAHDIRGPLSALGIAIELTKRDPEGSARKGVLERASRTLQRVGQLVDGLLVFARAGARPTEKAAADVAAVLEDVAETFRPLAEESHIELHIDVGARPVVACTPGVLISLLSNLVGNAIKYMGSAPLRRVDISARHHGDMVRLEVRDTGPGVPPSERERIFDPYVRAAASTVPGIGLGLATVRRLTEAHGGRVGVSPSDDSGSVFWLKLPSAEPGSGSARAGSEVSRAGSGSAARA